MNKDSPNPSAESLPEQRFLTASGQVWDRTLELVHPHLARLKKPNNLWCFLSFTYPGLKLGDKFSRIYTFTYGGLVLPVIDGPCVLTALQIEDTHDFEAVAHKISPMFRDIWGGYPIGLFKFPDKSASSIVWPIHKSHNKFFIGSGENYHATLQNESTPTIENIREFLDCLSDWTNCGDPHLGNYFDMECADSPEGPFYTIHDPRWKIRHEEIPIAQWQQSVRECAPHYGVLQIQLSRLFYLLRKLWRKPPSRAWKLFVSEGPFYGIFHDDFVMEVDGKFYLLHFSSSD